VKDQILALLTEVQNQAPEVARQMTSYAFVSSMVWIIGFVLILAMLAYVFFKEYDCSGDEETARVISFICAIFVLLMIGLCVDTAIQAKFYPKAYLAEKIIGGLK
jgi:hypothetical protein